MCGGTVLYQWRKHQRQGLSPRVRGNQLEGGIRVSYRGSIPACAGEPCSGVTPLFLSWVYPRVCGVSVLISPLV